MNADTRKNSILKIQDKEFPQKVIHNQDKQSVQQLYLQNLSNHQSSKIWFKYSQEVLSGNITQNLSNFSSKAISQQVLQPQLQEIKILFDKIPFSQCRIQNFLLIMTRAMNFTFEKIPYYLIGLKDMFYEILQHGKSYITYDQFHKHICGETISVKQQQCNTEFKMHFSQLKDQDYFVHDTGIKKIYYVKDLKVLLTLDENAQYVKIYNLEMKVLKKIVPCKQKHFNKHPLIKDFDYSEASYRLCLLLSDCTLSIINLDNFLKKTQSQFNTLSNNEITLLCPYSSRYLIYLQMINRWCVVTQKNLVLLFNPMKQKQQVYYEQLTLQNRQQNNIIMILEVIQTNMVCVVAGNQLLFYDETLTKIKCPKYQHKCDIITLRYSEDRNKFYLAGNQKIITILEFVRGTRQFKITFADFIQKYNIRSFEVFCSINTIVLINQRNQLKVYAEGKTTYDHMENYMDIVKNIKRKIQIYKTNKTTFAIFQTYLKMFTQLKVAIEKETEYNFHHSIYYDEEKQNIYFCVNNQIINFSLLNADIKINYSKYSSNLTNFLEFFVGEDTNIFIFDEDKNLYELYLKQEKQNSDSRNYKKRLIVQNVIKSFYYEPQRSIIIVSKDSISQIANKKDNNFAAISTCSFDKTTSILKAVWRDPIISLLSQSQIIYQLHYANYSVFRSIQYEFTPTITNYEQKYIISFDHDFHYGFDIIMNNSNEIYIISMMNETKQYCIKINDYLSYNDRNVVFTSIKYQKLGTGKIDELYLIFYNQNGYLGQFRLKDLIENFITTIEPPSNPSIKQQIIQKNINLHSTCKKTVFLHPLQTKCRKDHLIIMKAHDNSIELVAKIHLQFPVTLTVSKDGYTKLWLNYQCLFSLKLPLLLKSVWNLSKIEQAKAAKSLKMVLQIIEKINLLSNKSPSPIKTIKKGKIMRREDINKINFQEPLKINIQNEELEQIIRQTQQQSKISLTHKKTQKITNKCRKISVNHHPWRKNKQFLQIYKSLTPSSRSEMPRDLAVLRNGLDMTPTQYTSRIRTTSTSRNSSFAMNILPGLNEYVPEPISFKQKQTPQQEEQEQKLQVFEVCMHVRRTNFKKRVNQLDEIDKQFRKKWMQLTNKKWIPHHFNTSNDKNKKSISKTQIKNSINNSNIESNNNQITTKKQFNTRKKLID